MTRPSVMKHTFSEVPRAEIPRSAFDRSHGYKTTFDAGWLVPIFVDEALPGDTFNLSMTGFARLATPLHPYMDNVFMNTFFFAVPLRLIWNNWERFNGAQDNPDDSTDFIVPQMVSPVGGYAANSLSDYFGLPVGVAGVSHSALWHRAYNLIFNEWFRDQNLQDSVIVDKDDGPDLPTDYVLKRRGKRHDYFTSCLPWPQKGPSVPLPMTGNAPVYGDGTAMTLQTQTVHYGLGTGSNTLAAYAGSVGAALGTPASGATPAANALMNIVGKGGSNNSHVYADLSEVTAATINELRQAFQIQKLYERDARGGTRYTEIVQSHFGVTSPDARLQRPEYLGGGQSPVNVSPIAQTSGTAIQGSDTPQGNLAAIGTATLNGHGFVKSFTEHCVLIGMVSVRADLTYQQGMNRMFSRESRFDFYWPALAHIGEQAVLNKEIFCNGTATDTQVFGYQERFAEYRYKPSVVTGEFRSSFAQSLDTWHLAQDFASLPVLDAAFIEDNPPLDRVIAVTDEPHFLFDSYFRLRCARPMPVYAVPGLIDHF